MRGPEKLFFICGTYIETIGLYGSSRTFVDVQGAGTYSTSGFFVISSSS